MADVYNNHCILCLENVREDVKHFLLECRYLSSIRDSYEVQLSKLRALSNSRNELLGLILGNNTGFLSPDEEAIIQIGMIKMISKMLLVRSIRVSNEVSMVPT